MDNKIAAEWVDITSISPWAKNPRKNDAAIQKIADSIKRFGFGAPIVARKETGEIIAGHTRYKAAQLIGMSTVPVRFLDISEKDAHLLSLADNKLGEISQWDDTQVLSLLSNCSLGDTIAAGWAGDDLGELFQSITDGNPDDQDSSQQLGSLKYSVVIECADETEQSSIMDELEMKGYKCKSLIS